MKREELIEILLTCAEDGFTPMHNAVWRALDKHKDDEQVKKAYEKYEDSKGTFHRILI